MKVCMLLSIHHFHLQLDENLDNLSFGHVQAGHDRNSEHDPEVRDTIRYNGRMNQATSG